MENGAALDFARAAQLLTDTAARAGAAIMEHYHRGAAVMLKDDASPVTLADKDSEAIILKSLLELAPEIPVVSEEDADKPEAVGSRYFLVDPLDGTKEFIKKRSDFTVNIALIEQGQPSFGLVYAPARSLLAVTVAPGEAIEAELSPSVTGVDLAKLPQKRLTVRTADPNGLTVLVSLSHLDPETEAFLAKLKIAKRSGAGSSVKFLEIARGEADVLSPFRPDHGVGHGGGAGRARSLGRQGGHRLRRSAPLRQDRIGLAQSELHRLGTLAAYRQLRKRRSGELHGMGADVWRPRADRLVEARGVAGEQRPRRLLEAGLVAG